jgi:TldD protein
MSIEAIRFFADRYAITEQTVEQLLNDALSKGGDYADLYFEYRINSGLSLEEGIIKTATRSVFQGVGVRVIAGEKIGYAYSDEITPEKIKQAALTAASIAREPGQRASVHINGHPNLHDLYPVEEYLTDIEVRRKIGLAQSANRVARAYDRRVCEVQIGFADEYKVVMIAGSDGPLTGDIQPLARFNVSCIVEDNGNRQVGYHGGGGRVGLDFFNLQLTPEHMAREAARQAVLQLEAVDAPAGTMEVVLGPGWPGILLHEAIGHGLEADFNRKQVSAFSDRLGQRVASELCTVVDDGTIPRRRGSLNVDDEGTRTSRTTLIENGILVGYLTDRLNAQLMGLPLTGNGRRESYQHIPMPRMTNTFMLAGQETREDIIGSVKRGIYAVYFGGGQVDITNGNFVFSASEAYLIEDGKITAPIKGTTLIGNGPEVLKKVTAVGNDLELDSGIGMCGKDGQSVPVGVGLPTIKIAEMTVGGTQVA